MSHLRAADPRLRALIDAIGPCTLQPDRDLFRVLVQTIISQQISTRAALTIGRRLHEAVAPENLTPSSILALPADQLRACGLSASKLKSIRNLAEQVEGRTLNLKTLPRRSDEEIRADLLALHGIGPWSVDMVLIFGLGRMDVLPLGDLGLRVGVQKLLGAEQPLPSEMIEQATRPWQPFRSIATWYLWRSLGPVPQSGE